MTPIPYIHIAAAVLVMVVAVIAIIAELRARQRQRRHQRRQPVTLLTDAHSCMAHCHWARLRAARAATDRANTLPTIDEEARL